MVGLCISYALKQNEFPKTWWFGTIIICRLLQFLWVGQRCLVRLRLSDSLTGWGICFQGGLPPGKVALTLGGKVPILSTWASSWICVSVLMTWRPASSRASAPGNQSRCGRELYVPAPEVMHRCFHRIPRSQKSGRRRPHEHRNAEGKAIRGPPWRLATAASHT